MCNFSHTFVQLFIVCLCHIYGRTTVRFFTHDYCIIGAGPAGLQMGYFLEKAGRDYVIYEKNSIPGSFFKKYPRHRILISINKRHTGQQNREFNLRHDWNSLVTDDYGLLFTNYSKEYFPHADSLLQYLKDFSLKYKLKIKYRRQISGIRYNADFSGSKCRFSMKDQWNNSICCRTLLVATGLSMPMRAKIHWGNSSLLEYCDTVNIDPETFEGQSVLIVGNGNSGMELAKSIYGRTNFVHVASRNRIILSWETHYVGDIRAVNNDVLDAYMLKSLDGFFSIDTSQMNIRRRNDGSNKLDIFDSESLPKGHSFHERNPSRHGYDRIICCIGFKWDKSIFDSTMKITDARVMVKNYDEDPQHRVTYGRVIEKYPKVNYDYQSMDYNGLYFMGVLSHSLDYRKSAGGFIHGLRYTVRALHKLLEYKNHGVKWPYRIFDADELADNILGRANEASGLYQMFQNLCDVAIVDKSTNIVTYLEEYPVKLVPQLSHQTGHTLEATKHVLFVLTLEYGKNFSEPGIDHFSSSRAGLRRPARLSNFLHPVVYFYNDQMVSNFDNRPSTDNVPEEYVHHIVEDFTTIFDGPNAHRKPLKLFVDGFIGCKDGCTLQDIP